MGWKPDYTPPGYMEKAVQTYSDFKTYPFLIDAQLTKEGHEECYNQQALLN